MKTAQIRMLPGVKGTPQITLNQVLENVDNFDAVAIVAMNKDRTCSAWWSNMTISELCFMVRNLQITVDDMIAERTPIPPGEPPKVG